VDWGRVQFFFSEVWRSFTRNVLMQVTAIGTVAVTIVLLGSFLFTRATLASIGNDVVRKIEISVFLNDGTSAADVKKLQARIAADPRVHSVTFVPKAEGLHEMRERLKGQIDTSLLTANPLPDKFRVRVEDPQQVPAVATLLGGLPGVANVVYAQDAVMKVLHLSDVLGRIGLVIVAVLVFTAAIIISNTIRLTVFARRREIAIMQLVGASSMYIRMPFVFEGTIAGLCGALVAIGLLALAKIQLLGVGAGVGLLASWISVSRYLRA